MAWPSLRLDFILMSFFYLKCLFRVITKLNKLVWGHSFFQFGFSSYLLYDVKRFDSMTKHTGQMDWRCEYGSKWCECPVMDWWPVSQHFWLHVCTSFLWKLKQVNLMGAQFVNVYPLKYTAVLLQMAWLHWKLHINDRIMSRICGSETLSD